MGMDGNAKNVTVRKYQYSVFFTHLYKNLAIIHMHNKLD